MKLSRRLLFLEQNFLLQYTEKAREDSIFDILNMAAVFGVLELKGTFI